MNPEQRRAAAHEGGVLVLAGAGTGKTRVLTSRIGWLIKCREFSPRSILAVTFTNKAAKEMRARVLQMVAFRTGELALGTFHGICHRMLRIHAAAAGWDKNFQIMDSQDQKSALRRMLSALGASTEEFPPADCMGYINAAKERGMRAEGAPASSTRARAMREIYQYYEKMCRDENKMDFAELLLSAAEVLQNDKELRQHYAARFRHVLIDEFQDTNMLQYRWLKLLDSGENDYFAVGDDDQAIYGFRGGDKEYMSRVQTELRATEIIRLEQNYRSTGNILGAANAVIARNKSRIGKNLNTDGGGGALLQIAAAMDDSAEANAVAAKILQKIGDGGRADDIAVLYRTNAQSRLLEKALIENGIPYRIYGGLRFFDRLETKHALAYLRLAAADDLDSLLRVINMPPRGIGKKTVESLAAGGDYFAALSAAKSPKVAVFRDIVRELRRRREDGASLPELARAAVEQSGLLAFYESRPEEAGRADNVREFVSAAGQFQAEGDEEPVQAFLANAALESGEAQSGEKNAPAVNLMTVHAAKGLEFSSVFITGLEDGMFPSSQSLDAAAENAVEEERRLMYVALTRACKELFLYFAASRMVFGQTQVRPPSRFLDELPAAVLESAAAFTRPPAMSAPSAAPFGADFPPAVRQTKKENTAPRGGEPYRPGDVVGHPKYGKGVVVSRKGRGEDLKVEVAFKQIGVKTFLAAVAPLLRL